MDLPMRCQYQNHKCNQQNHSICENSTNTHAEHQLQYRGAASTLEFLWRKHMSGYIKFTSCQIQMSSGSMWGRAERSYVNHGLDVNYCSGSDID